MTLATLAIAAACWFGPAWIWDSPVRMNAAWPEAGHSMRESPPPSAPRCSVRRAPLDGVAVEDDDAADWKPRAAAIAVNARSGRAARILRVRRALARAGW